MRPCSDIEYATPETAITSARDAKEVGMIMRYDKRRK